MTNSEQNILVHTATEETSRYKIICFSDKISLFYWNLLVKMHILSENQNIPIWFWSPHQTKN